MCRLLFHASSLLALAATCAFAEPTDEYFLSLPIGYGDARGAPLCAKAAEHANSGCNVLTLPDPVNGAVVSITEVQSLGSLDELGQRFAGDFVPWPWSRKPDGTLLPEDFAQGSQLPIMLNPCSVMMCAEGSECIWNPEQPLGKAYCSGGGEGPVTGLLPGVSHLPFGRIVPAVPMTTLSADAGEVTQAAAEEQAKRNDLICGQRSPGKICMGTHILDEDGRYWQIP